MAATHVLPRVIPSFCLQEKLDSSVASNLLERLIRASEDESCSASALKCLPSLLPVLSNTQVLMLATTI